MHQHTCVDCAVFCVVLVLMHVLSLASHQRSMQHVPMGKTLCKHAKVVVDGIFYWRGNSIGASMQAPHFCFEFRGACIRKRFQGRAFRPDFWRVVCSAIMSAALRSGKQDKISSTSASSEWSTLRNAVMLKASTDWQGTGLNGKRPLQGMNLARNPWLQQRVILVIQPYNANPRNKNNLMSGSTPRWWIAMRRLV